MNSETDSGSTQLEAQKKESANDLMECDTPIEAFPRVSLWLVFPLTLFTLWIYPIYWFVTRARIINTLVESKINIAIFIFYALIAITSIGADFFLPKEVLEEFGFYISLLYLIVHGIIIYLFVDRIGQILFSSKVSFNSVNGFLSFLFSPFYLQYKINQAIEEKEAKNLRRQKRAAGASPVA